MRRYAGYSPAFEGDGQPEVFIFKLLQKIHVSYNATLLNVESEMAEFAVHEYQAKVMLNGCKYLRIVYPSCLYYVQVCLSGDCL